MKKIFLLIAAITLISFPVIFNSCEEEDNSVACTSYSIMVKSARIDYTWDQSLEKCENYKKALKAYLNEDCDDLDDDDFKTIMNSLPC